MFFTMGIHLDALLLPATWIDAYATMRVWWQSLVLSYTDPDSKDFLIVSLEDPRGFPLALLIIVSLLFLAIYLLLRAALVDPIARYLFKTAAKGTNRDLTKRSQVSRHQKFLSCVMEAFSYSLSFYVGLIVAKRQTWMWPSRQWWIWTDTPETKVDAGLALFYIGYAARYVVYLVVVLMDHKRADFMEMIIHHITTIVLVGTSFAFGYIRVGLAVMVVFDIADPALHLAKICTYLKEVSPESSTRKKWLSHAADGFFILFFVLFLLTRIIAYGYICLSVIYEGYYYSLPDLDFVLGFQRAEMAQHFCVVLVFIIFGLQVFWLILLLKMIRKHILGLELKDIRSSGSEDEHEEEEKKSR